MNLINFSNNVISVKHNRFDRIGIKLMDIPVIVSSFRLTWVAK